MNANEGQRITTRYWGGMESVRVLQVHDTYYVVSRFGGQVSDILPKDGVTNIFDADNNIIFSSESEDGLHPALR